MVDGCMRSSDPNIYAVGEVASYEGGMVYGLWKPGMEQAEVRQQQRNVSHEKKGPWLVGLYRGFYYPVI